MRFYSWNVNGIRAAIKKGFWDWFHSLDADIVCLQEVRALPEQVDVDLPGWKVHWNPAEKKGYSGTAIFSRAPLVEVTRGLGVKKYDGEGRVITAELEDCFLVNVYTPNAQRDLARRARRVPREPSGQIASDTHRPRGHRRERSPSRSSS